MKLINNISGTKNVDVAKPSNPAKAKAKRLIKDTDEDDLKRVNNGPVTNREKKTIKKLVKR